MRPPLSQERLRIEPDGRVRVAFKSAWKDGTRAAVLHPLDFISRLSALVPPPRFHMLRCLGVLAGHAKARAEVAAGPRPKLGAQLALLDAAEPEPKPPSRRPWAWLLARVFAADLTECMDCGGRMRLLGVVTERADIERILRGHRPSARAPPDPAQLELDFCAA